MPDATPQLQVLKVIVWAPPSLIAALLNSTHVPQVYQVLYLLWHAFLKVYPSEL